MVKIEYEDEMLFITCSGSRFTDQVESCKYLKMMYDPKKKAWKISVGKFNEVIDELNQYHIELSEYDKKEIKSYFNNLTELKRLTKRSEYRKFNQDLLKVEPIG